MAPADGATCLLHSDAALVILAAATDQSTEDTGTQAGQEEAEIEDSFWTRMEDLVVPPVLQTLDQTQCEEEERKRRDEKTHGRRGLIILHPTFLFECS